MHIIHRPIKFTRKSVVLCRHENNMHIPETIIKKNVNQKNKKTKVKFHVCTYDILMYN